MLSDQKVRITHADLQNDRTWHSGKAACVMSTFWWASINCSLFSLNLACFLALARLSGHCHQKITCYTDFLAKNQQFSAIFDQMAWAHPGRGKLGAPPACSCHPTRFSKVIGLRMAFECPLNEQIVRKTVVF